MIISYLTKLDDSIQVVLNAHTVTHIEPQIIINENESFFSDEKFPDLKIFFSVHIY